MGARRRTTSRELRRHRVPARHCGRSHLARGENCRGRGCLRGDDRRPIVQERHVTLGGPQGTDALRGNAVRSGDRAGLSQYFGRSPAIGHRSFGVDLRRADHQSNEQFGERVCCELTSRSRCWLSDAGRGRRGRTGLDAPPRPKPHFCGGYRDAPVAPPRSPCGRNCSARPDIDRCARVADHGRNWR